MPRTVDDVLRECETIFADRLRQEAPGPRDACDDELLVAEILSLRLELERLRDLLTDSGNERDTYYQENERLRALLKIPPRTQW